MTWQELLRQLNTLTNEQLNQIVNVYIVFPKENQHIYSLRILYVEENDIFLYEEE